MMPDNSHMAHVYEEMRFNDPPIVVGDFWSGPNDLRRVRIVAKHPFREDTWIYEEHPAKLKTGRMKGELGICPEFNLRYIFRPEAHDDKS